jgi:hypothetical protein
MSDILEAYFSMKKDEMCKAESKKNPKSSKSSPKKGSSKSPEKKKASTIVKKSVVRPSSVRQPRPMSGKDTTPTKTMSKDDAKLVKPLDIEDEAAQKNVSVEFLKAIQKQLREDQSSIEAIMNLVYDVKMTNDPHEIMNTYQRNANRCSKVIPGGQSEV